MNNVIDLQKKRREKIQAGEKRKKELEKRRRFVLNMDEANILMYTYVNYINAQLEGFKELKTEEDKQIGKNEIRTMFSLLKMLFKKYKNSDYYDDISMSWNYKNLYNTIMAIYASLDVDVEYEFMEKDEKIEMNLYYRFIDLDHAIGELIHGPSINFSETPSWLEEEELIAENDYQVFKHLFNEEFLNKVVLMEVPLEEGEGFYGLRQYPKEFRSVLRKLSKEGCAKKPTGTYPKGWRLALKWEDLLEKLSGFNVEVVPLLEQEKEEVSHIYSVELLEEQVADIISRMDNIGIKANSAFLNQ